MDSSSLQHVIDDILINPSSLSKEEFQQKYADFFTKYPTLSEKVFDDKLDKQTLRYLLTQKSKMETNNQTEYDASVKVGSMLVDKYVKPNLKQ